MLGFCPQCDALNLFMTAFESVKYMALLRGSFGPSLDDRVMQMLRKTDLEQFTNVKCGKYSGGTKRKLNTAMAMVYNTYSSQTICVLLNTSESLAIESDHSVPRRTDDRC